MVDPIPISKASSFCSIGRAPSFGGSEEGLGEKDTDLCYYLCHRGEKESKEN